MNRPEFTKEQEDWICYQIGEWYLAWKAKIAPCEHLLGIAKEDLKELLCNYPVKEPDHIIDLFIDFQRIHSYLRMACEKEKDEIRQEYDPDFLIEEGDKLYVKWLHLSEKLRNEMIDILNEEFIKKRDNGNGK